MLVPALKFLYTSSEIPLKYEYYNPKNNTRYLNLNEFNNTNNSININDSIKSLIEILPKLPITDKKLEIQLPISFNIYYESFPNFLRGFFDGLIDVEHITKCVTLFASLIISIAFPYLGVCGHTDSNECRIEKQRMTKVNPTERLIKRPNIWNLTVIDNIDFKEKSFTYRNIFDTTCKSSHTTLRMAFQMRMPIPLEERADDKKNVTSLTGLFGMNDLMKDTWDKFDDIIDNLLNFQTSSKGQLLYNTDFDMAVIHQKILESVDYSCSANAPNIVILETAKVSGVKFLDKLDKIVDYRSTVCVLELIWCAVTLSIRIYMKKINLNKYNIMDSSSGANSILRIWYLYYKWASIFKAHHVGIRVGNYKLQKNALACFVSLFASAGKSNYSVSVTQYLGMLVQYPKLEENWNVFLKFIKQNITGNGIDDNKLKLQVKAAQSEHDRIEILLSEYLNDPCGSIGQRAVETRKTAMWKLVNELLSAFEHSDNYNRYQNPLWSTTSPDQIIVTSIERLENCFPNGILRIEAIFLQDVISVQKKNSISDQQVPTNSIPQIVVMNKDEPPIKKPKQACCETKPKEKSLLEPLVTCSEYLNDEQIEQVREMLGNEWDKDRIYQYIFHHRHNKNNKNE
ncbi:hypothetical protein C1646_776936 [Rhizophagus diaphanus]|nr:hypothetical protein C1646_776936 [Rhizophagus diaphanus] [Rhizophagus sp. MUCL 43196]